jgi:hypothetical protein
VVDLCAVLLVGPAPQHCDMQLAGPCPHKYLFPPFRPSPNSPFQHNPTLLKLAHCLLPSSPSLHLLPPLQQPSVVIQLAVALDPSQAASGTPDALAAWLGDLNNLRRAMALAGARDPFGPSVTVRWVQPPTVLEMATPPVVNKQTVVASTVGAAIGVVVGCVLAGVVGLVLWRRHQRKARREAAAAAQNGDLPTSRRRVRGGGGLQECGAVGTRGGARETGVC